MENEKQIKILESYGRFKQKHTDDMPSWYSGVYFNDNDDMVLCVTHDFSENEKIFDCDYTIKYVTYSYKYLNDLKQDIFKRLTNPEDDLKAMGLNKKFIGCAVYEPDNKVHVVFENINDEDRQNFYSNICEPDAFMIIEGKRTVKQIMVFASDTLNSGGQQFTMGYAAKKNDGSKGFVTCGHMDAKVGDKIQKIDTNGIDVANIERIQCDVNLDACFASLIKGNSVSNKISQEYALSINSSNENYITNASVTMYGGVSEVQKGRIEYLSFDSIELKDQIACTYSAQCGDSGAPVIISGTGNVIGIHVASEDTGNFAYSVKVPKINNTFGLSVVRS